VTTYGLDGWGSSLGGGKNLFLSIVPTHPLLPWVPGVKRLGSEADYSPRSSAEVKNGGTLPPLPHVSSWHSA
jgi:hypothetical protein